MLDTWLDKLRLRFTRPEAPTLEWLAPDLIAGYPLPDLQAAVRELDALGISFDLRRTGKDLVPLTEDIPEYVLRRHLANYLVTVLLKDEAIDRVNTARRNTVMRSADMYAFTPMPVLGNDGQFYIPDPESGE